MHMPPMTIWVRDSPPAGTEPVLLWNSFDFADQHPGTISLPRFIEENAVEIRSRLLAFLCDVRFVPLKSRSLEEALQTPVGLSTWWLSFPSLKQLGRRQSIPIACRLIAIEMIVGSDALPYVNIECDDKNVNQLINSAINAKRRLRSFRSTLSFLRRRIVLPARAVLSLIRYATILCSTRVTDPTDRNETTHDFAFFDYFAHSTSLNDESRPYSSPFWGEIPTLCEEASWFHIYPKNVDRKGIVAARRQLSLHNKRSRAHHELFIDNLNVNDVSSLVSTYFKQVRTHQQARRILLHYQLPTSKLRLWHVFEDEWNESILGSTAMRHLILLFTTNRLVATMPHFKKVFYLLENQPWELALTHCVKRHSKGHLVGVAHSTIRFWDLRYFMDPRENSLVNTTCTRPLPTRIFTNGVIGTKLLLENSYPQDSVTMVEALRYGYLQDLRYKLDKNRSNILLLGDFLEHANESLVEVFRNAIIGLKEVPQIQIRSHPICPLTSTQLGPLARTVSDRPLAELLTAAGIVVTTAASSSAAEAVALGIPTIVVLDGCTLNYSPFRQSNEVHTAESSGQLAELLESCSTSGTTGSDQIFCLDGEYPRWRAELLVT